MLSARSKFRNRGGSAPSSPTEGKFSKLQAPHDVSFDRLKEEGGEAGKLVGKALSPAALQKAWKSPEAERMERILNRAAERAEGLDPRLDTGLKYIQPAVTILCKGLCVCLPLYFKLLTFLYGVWTRYIAHSAPLVKMVFGSLLCFFGGTFVATIAAAEALNQMGGKQAYADVAHVVSQLSVVKAASDKEDAVDADGDGIGDMDELMVDKPQEWARRKLLLGLTAVDDPQRLSSAVRNLWSSCLAVLATLRLQFARTTAIALGIVEVVSPIAKRLCYEPLLKVMGTGLVKWADIVIDGVLGIVAISIAWYLQMIVSMYYSALRGGTMFAGALFELVNAMGWATYIGWVPFVTLDEEGRLDMDDTIIDEVVGYLVAGCGMWFQLSSGFHLPLGVNILLMPVSVFEAYLRLQISSAAMGKAAPPGAAASG